MTADERIAYQECVLDLVNDLLDNHETKVTVEFTQHKGDIGDPKDAISTHYALVKFRKGHGANAEKLHAIMGLAMRRGAKLAVDEDGGLILWPLAVDHGS